MNLKLFITFWLSVIASSTVTVDVVRLITPVVELIVRMSKVARLRVTPVNCVN